MFKKMLSAVISTTNKNLFGSGANIDTDNLNNWMALQRALDTLSNDTRYEILFWKCAYKETLHTDGLEQRLYHPGDDIIRNDIYISMEWDRSGKKRVILIRQKYAREIDTPMEQYLGIISNYEGSEYNYELKKMAPTTIAGPAYKARVYGYVDYLVGIGWSGFGYSFDDANEWIKHFDQSFTPGPGCRVNRPDK